jgi:hypothetical protein
LMMVIKPAWEKALSPRKYPSASLGQAPGTEG